MLTLGLPATAVMALMIGALTIQGIQPGPRVIAEQPALFWGLVVSMLVGNVFLVVLNLPLVGLWVRLLSVPYRLLYPGILLICAIGVYALERQALDVVLCGIFAAAGYLLALLECEPAPLLFGMILSPLLEENFRRALMLSNGQLTVFVTEPISLVLLLAAVALVAAMALPRLRARRGKVFRSDGGDRQGDPG
jgi:TctA family transporter